MARRRVGLGEDDVEVGDAGVGDEALAAVEHVLVAVAPRLGAHRRRVRARAGLGQRVRGQPLAARKLRQEALLLLVRPGQLDPERAELLHGEDQAGRRADLRELLDRDEHHQRAGAGAAVLLLERQPEQVVLAASARPCPTGTRRLRRSRPPPRALGVSDGGRSRARVRDGSRIALSAERPTTCRSSTPRFRPFYRSFSRRASAERRRARLHLPRLLASAYASFSSATESRRLTSRRTISSWASVSRFTASLPRRAVRRSSTAGRAPAHRSRSRDTPAVRSLPPAATLSRPAGMATRAIARAGPRREGQVPLLGGSASFDDRGRPFGRPESGPRDVLRLRAYACVQGLAAGSRRTPPDGPWTHRGRRRFAPRRARRAGPPTLLSPAS